MGVHINDRGMMSGLYCENLVCFILHKVVMYIIFIESSYYKSVGYPNHCRCSTCRFVWCFSPSTNIEKHFDVCPTLPFHLQTFPLFPPIQRLHISEVWHFGFRFTALGLKHWISMGRCNNRCNGWFIFPIFHVEKHLSKPKLHLNEF